MPTRPPRRGSLRVRLELGLAAFAPAFGLLAYRSRGSAWIWLPFGLAAAGVLVLVAGAFIVVRGNPEPFDFSDIEDLGDEILGHIGAYLVPALVDTAKFAEEIVLSIIIVGLIVQIHVTTGRVFVNPLLYLIGYRVYSAKTGSSSFYLVARSEVNDWTTPHRCVQIGSSVLVERHH